MDSLHVRGERLEKRLAQLLDGEKPAEPTARRTSGKSDFRHRSVADESAQARIARRGRRAG